MAQAHRWLLTRDFSLMWWSQVLSQVAEGISKLALLWFVYAVTGSPLKTTVIGLLQTLPPILFGPFIGVIVDRFPKKTILIGSDIARGVLIGLIPCLVSVEHFTVGSLYLLTFLYGVATAVFVPYDMALMNVSAMSFGSLSGPAITALNEGARRMHLLPSWGWRLQQVPLRIHHPVWVEDPDFVIEGPAYV